MSGNIELHGVEMNSVTVQPSKYVKKNCDAKYEQNLCNFILSRRDLCINTTVGGSGGTEIVLWGTFHATVKT